MPLYPPAPLRLELLYFTHAKTSVTCQNYPRFLFLTIRSYLFYPFYLVSPCFFVSLCSPIFYLPTTPRQQRHDHNYYVSTCSRQQPPPSALVITFCPCHANLLSVTHHERTCLPHRLVICFSHHQSHDPNRGHAVCQHHHFITTRVMIPSEDMTSATHTTSARPSRPSQLSLAAHHYAACMHTALLVTCPFFVCSFYHHHHHMCPPAHVFHALNPKNICNLHAHGTSFHFLFLSLSHITTPYRPLLNLSCISTATICARMHTSYTHSTPQIYAACMHTAPLATHTSRSPPR